MLPGKKLTPADVLQIARRRALLIAIPPILALFAALVYSSRVPNVYQSDMLIAVDPQRVPDAFVRSTVTLGTERRMDTISVQVLSRTNLQRLIEQLDLYRDERDRLPIDDVVSRMRGNIIVELERSRGQDAPNAFHVRFTHADPAIAARVTQQIGTLFVEQNSSDRASLATATNSFLETQLNEARGRLEAQERRLEGFRERHGQSLPTQMPANLQALQNMQMQVQSLVESVARDRDRKQMLDRLYRDAASEPAAVYSSPGSSGQSGGAPAATSAQQQLATARSQLAGFEVRYTPDHPDVVRTKRLIAELEPKAAAEATAARERPADGVAATDSDPKRRENLRQMRAEIESLARQTEFKESEERRIRGEITQYQSRVEAVPGLESEWSALTRDYDTQQAAYKDLLSKSGSAKVAAALEQEQIGEHFRIVDPAVVPVHPVASPRARINLGGLILGLVVGVGLSALIEVRDTSFHTEAEVLEVLALPVLASIPRVETAAELVRRARHNTMLMAGGAVCVVAMAYVTWMLKLWNSLA